MSIRNSEEQLVVPHILAWMFSIFILSTAISKLMDIYGTVEIASQYALIPISLALPVVVITILIEIWVGIYLAYDPNQMVISTAQVLIVIYSIAIAVDVIIGRVHECGCHTPFGGIDSGPVGSLIRNVILLVFLHYLRRKFASYQRLAIAG